MDRHNDHGRLSKKVSKKLPEVYIDEDLDCASIKIAHGVESKSYVKDGFVFCEDSRGVSLKFRYSTSVKLEKSRGKGAKFSLPRKLENGLLELGK
jgi:hypothetical protein